MAKTPEGALGLMEAVWPAATARVQEEVADMQAVANAEGANITIEPWDYRYYAEKVRRAKYDLDSDEVKQYLQLGKLREAMFFVAGELFGFQFSPVAEGSVPVFHPDVKVWEVTNKASGDHIGLWYLDPYARTGQALGRLGHDLSLSHETFDGQAHTCSDRTTPTSSRLLPARPCLHFMGRCRPRYFHEFGHALHLPLLDGGLSVSQWWACGTTPSFNPNCSNAGCMTDEVIDSYLVHCRDRRTDS